ncbi:transcription factor GTE4-like isoform X1 [Salvia splendens]|uniref:transcription factor GTE4-like isoform X1 n=1 Tax=Salvia splendens TaxID=180675 RepID=UPI001C26A5B2|nr:transcription factor GTE4-like isoform X1 [Salvia splendens]XP_042007564.1 transcription factor GTE4-like isoform X1 [Salvia splendens]
MLGDGNEGSDEDKLGERKVYSRTPSFKGLENSHSSSNLLMEQQQQLKSQAMVSDGLNSMRRMHDSGVDVGRDGFVGISLSRKSKRDALELRRKLERERDKVRSMMRRIESLKNGVQGFDCRDGDNVAAGWGTPRMLKPLNPLSVVVDENGKPGSDTVEKEKRTPKESKLYGNTEFLLAKDKIPHGESKKKLKANGKKGGGSGAGKENFPNHVLKSCNALLERLMKHKHAWVFNKPVDAVALGLHDYFEIIRNPMDLGTVKGRLTQNWYKSPMEFAEDVVLTFQNAMTYNPKGQDVYVMAEQLCKLFEDKWAPIEAGYKREMNLAAEYDVGPPMPTSRKAPQQPRAWLDMEKPLDRSAMAYSGDPKRKKPSSAQSGKVHAPKKPKAKDQNKREMTYDEKQKLSVNLQELPSEKLENVVHIIKKRNPSVSQQDDEIEVDIDSVDTETLWELDRFIANYKKNLSKNKRKAEIVNNLIAGQEQIPNDMQVATSVVTEMPIASRTDEEKIASPPAELEVPDLEHCDKNQGVGQNSSSSDLGSSSSDSEGETSSADGSDGEHSPEN